MSTLHFMFGQDAIIHILTSHGGKATRDEIRQEILTMIEQGLVAASQETLYSRQLNAMCKAYKLRKVTEKHTGRILHYELLA